MDFESPDVMRDFPGLYASEISKQGSNDSDYSDDADKNVKKDILGKRKDKKDKKDKERGYAALEGESSAEESDTKGLSRIKKAKAFKFASSKSKEKREKSREKELIEKKKEKEKKVDKKGEKDKLKPEKKDKKGKCTEEHSDIADGLPIFGVPLDLSVERSRCHDGIDIPLPVRMCVDYVQMLGLTMEGVYKISGTKSKVIQLRKLFNQREPVDFSEYDVPVATSLLKMYLRDLPEPIFTSDLLIRFEEAGAILNVGTREKHLKTLVENLPKFNRILLSWLLIHFDNVVLNERLNKMNIQHVVTALSPVMHTSTKLLTALLHHCRALFPTVILDTYIPPVSSSAKLPDDLTALDTELCKQESLLSQIHSEMNSGFISKRREELLWEVQRVITQLKRKIKNLQKGPTEKNKKPETKEAEAEPGSLIVGLVTNDMSTHLQPITEPDSLNSESSPSTLNSEATILCNTVGNGRSSKTVDEPQQYEQCELLSNNVGNFENFEIGDTLALLMKKNAALTELKNTLKQNISLEKGEITSLKKQLLQLNNNQHNVCQTFVNNECSPDFHKFLDLLQKENQILQIKKVNLVRKIMEQKEVCLDLRSKLSVTN